MVEVFFLKPKSKAEPNAKEDGEWTALHLAAANGHKAVVAQLLQANADTKADTNDGETPLQTAKRYGRTAVAEMLQQAQAVH